jgi:hypothetical protein
MAPLQPSPLFTDGETPHAAIDACVKRWPALRFLLKPLPAD